MALSFWGLVAFIDFSATKARTVQSELFERDLRDLANHFDTDERFVLERNLEPLLSLTRPLGPLVLPRQYYMALPSSRSRTLPRQPPRNCFVDLAPTAPSQLSPQEPDRFCSYFVENQSLGEFVFLNFELSDDSIVPLKSGDISLAADSLEIELRLNGVVSKWRIFIQSAGQDSAGRYEITAFRKRDNGVVERDRRLEGWAFSRLQGGGTQKLYMLARLDIKEFLPRSTAVEGETTWPPIGWDKAQFTISRQDYSSSNRHPLLIPYASEGTSNLSITALASPIFAARASLEVTVSERGIVRTRYQIRPSEFADFSENGAYIKYVEGDILIRSNPLIRAQPIADTSLELLVKHPGFVVERGVWRVFIWLLALAIGAIIAVIFFWRRLLRPIYVLSRHARNLALRGTSGELLPYEDNKDEIGILSKAFNELIGRVREHVQREVRESAQREAEEAARREATIRNREENLNIIGHEIRSPLQALVSLHGPGTESRRYLDRMLSALPHLQQGMAAEDAISSRKLYLETIDMATLMQEIAANAELVNIPDVVYEGEDHGVECIIDAEAFEDVIDNILRNADRHRASNTPITITVRRIDEGVSIRVTNTGSHIPSEIIDKIFDYGFSTAPKKNGDGNGVGLWVARRYLAKMRGSISAMNIPDSEVSFEILLPEHLES